MTMIILCTFFLPVQSAILDWCGVFAQDMVCSKGSYTVFAGAVPGVL